MRALLLVSWLGMGVLGHWDGMGGVLLPRAGKTGTEKNKLKHQDPRASLPWPREPRHQFPGSGNRSFNHKNRILKMSTKNGVWAMIEPDLAQIKNPAPAAVLDFGFEINPVQS